MRRPWSIRARTALVFAVATMGITVAVLVFVNAMSLASFSRSVSGDRFLHPTDQPATPLPELHPVPDGSAGDSLAVVSTVAGIQWQWSAVGVTAAGIVAGLVGWLLARRVLAPVDRITATTRRMSASTLHERIALEGPDDELRRLSRTIDDLFDRLDTAFESQRRFVAQASHELRTPLAVQRTAIQVGLHDGAGDDEVEAVRAELLAQNRRTEQLVESLLVLAEAERGLDGRQERVDLAALVDDVVAEHRAGARAADVALRVRRSGSGPVVVLAEVALARQLLRNLVDNAIEYNEPGGFVEVVVGDRAVTVENSGAVVPAGAVAQLTEPFRRGSPDRPVSDRDGRRHSGVGLSIVQAVASAHAWSLGITARSSGGLVVRVGVSSVQPDVAA